MQRPLSELSEGLFGKSRVASLCRPMSERNVFALEKLTKSYGRKPVLNEVSLVFLENAKIGVIGANGAGKSTLLRIMAGQDTEFDGIARPADNLTVGYVPQEPHLAEELTVRENVELAVQPIIAMSSRANTGPAVEVLIRLPDGGGKTVKTSEFLKSAERYQLMPQIDRWVVSATLGALASGDIKLAGKRSCAINLSGQTLADEAFLGYVVEGLDRTAVSPSSICFEVTEKAILGNVQHAQRFIEVLHGIGCESSLDDFGSGLGSFSSLKHLPIDYLKIDGMYTRNLHTDEVNQEMVSAMIKLARTMQFRVVAEQVEHQEDFDWLRREGVDFMQGHFVESPATLGTGTTGTYRILNTGS